MSWQQRLERIESAWLAYVPRALAKLVRANPGERIYAAAFWLFSCDYTVIGPPPFGANAEGALANGGEGNRWVPADWKWDVLDAVVDEVNPLYLELSAAMADAPQAEWDALIVAHDQLMARVCRTITASVRSRAGAFGDLALPRDFVVVAIDEGSGPDHYNAMVRASVDEAILPTLAGLLVPDE